jgi:hypothetical protein
VATYSGTTASSYWPCRAIVTQESQNITGNTSSVKVVFQIGRQSGTGNSYGQTQNASYYIDIGDNKSGTIQKAYNWNLAIAGQWKEIASRTVTVPHNADGTKTVSFKCRWESNISPAWIQVSGNFALTRIPRQTSFSTTELKVASSYKVTLTPPSTGLTHTVNLKYKNFDKSYNVAKNVNTLTVSANDTSLLYAQMPTANSAKATMTVTNSLGLSKSAEINIAIDPAKAKPIFSSFTFMDDSAAVQVTNNNQVFVKGVSKVKVVISAANAAKSNTGATIKHYIAENGASNKKTVTYNASGNTIVLDNVVESNSISVTAVDGRNNETKVTPSGGLALIQYYKPRVASAKVVRENGVGSRIFLTVNIDLFSEGLGQATNQIVSVGYAWRVKGVSQWTTGTTSLPNQKNFTIAIRGDLGSDGFDSKTYDLRIRVADLLQSSNDHLLTINSGIPVMDMYRNNTTVGVGIGKRWEQGALDVKGDIHTSGNLYQKNNKVWTLADLQFKSGSINITPNANNVVTVPITYMGHPFSETPRVSANPHTGRPDITSVSMSGSTVSANIYLYRASSSSINVSWIAVRGSV